MERPLPLPALGPQRYCQAEHAIVEDWRWAVGAVPWGPYSNYTALRCGRGGVGCGRQR